MRSKALSLTFLSSVCACAALGCYPTPGPDKALAGAILGAGWGAGAGAVIGNQLNDTGPGAAIGAGFGAASGLVTGIGLDAAEGEELRQQRELDSLKVQVANNQRALIALQDSLDDRQRRINSAGYSEPVYFDSNRASIRLGSAAQLERLASSMKANPYVNSVELHGHADEAGSAEENRRLSEARARTVAGFLSTHGVSIDQMKIYAHGAQRPITTNETESGRQLNRRVEIVLRP